MKRILLTLIKDELSYPEFLENWWNNRLENFLKNKRSSFGVIQRDIQKLRDLFTISRKKGFGDYAGDEGKLLAYGLFIFPKTFVSIRFPLIEIINKDYLEINNTLNILDLGAGFGAGFLSTALLLRRFNASCRINILAVEISQKAGAVFKEFYEELSELHAECNIVFMKENIKNLKKVSDKKWDLVLVNFSLGEAFYNESDIKVLNWLEGLIDLLTDRGVILITEPALKETSERLERIRDMIIQKDIARVYAPCPHQFLCPLLKEGRFHCHEVRKWEVPSSIIKIDRRAQYWLNHLKFSFLAVGKRQRIENVNRYRLISPVVKAKGRFIASLCGWDGEKFPLNVRTKDKVAKILTALSRGDELEFMVNPSSAKSLQPLEIQRVFSLGKSYDPQLFLDVTA